MFSYQITKQSNQIITSDSITICPSLQIIASCICSNAWIAIPFRNSCYAIRFYKNGPINSENSFRWAWNRTYRSRHVLDLCYTFTRNTVLRVKLA